MMDDLTAFLNARLDEDEAVARAAAGNQPKWIVRDHPSDSVMVRDFSGMPLIYDESTPNDDEACHIARHDPARVLREVEARRRILSEVKDQIDNMDAVVAEEWDPDRYYSADTTVASDLLLKLLAFPYSDHPDYRPEWKP